MMKMLDKMKYAACGFLAGAVFFGSVAFAATSKIDVLLGEVKFLVNGVDKTPQDGMFDNNGTKVPHSFVYSGTTYVPIRMVSQLLNIPVKWDAANNTVVLGNENNRYLSDMIADSIEGKVETNLEYENNEKNLVFSTYKGSSNDSKRMASIQYIINKEYQTLSFYPVADGQTMIVDIYGDGEKLWGGVINDGQTIGRVSINVADVHLLQIRVEQQNENNVLSGGWGSVRRTFAMFYPLLEAK
jgi:Copper amine oxidase N-terminal domain.